MDGVSAYDVVEPSADLVRDRLATAIAIKQEIAAGVYPEQVLDIARVMIDALRSGNKVIFFGNGGSAQDAGHLSAELMGRFGFDRPGLSAMSLPDATAAMTASTLRTKRTTTAQTAIRHRREARVMSLITALSFRAAARTAIEELAAGKDGDDHRKLHHAHDHRDRGTERIIVLLEGGLIGGDEPLAKA